MRGTIVRMATAGKPRLVVLGTGWGGYAFLKSLSRTTLSQLDVKVVSPTTSFSFTPLLAQASCGTLDFRSALEPIHSTRGIAFHHAWCDALDLCRQRIEVTPASKPEFRPADPLSPANPTSPARAQEAARTYSIAYDYLVVAVGSYNATYGTEGVKENALFLKDVSDARAIRWKILSAFESTNAAFSQPLSNEDEDQVRARLGFVVVGGGPTGAEFAAELHDLIRQDLTKLYPHLARLASIKLLDAGKSILSSFDRGLAEYAMQKFARDGIEVVLNARINSVTDQGVWVQNPHGGAELTRAGMVVWSTGITAAPIVKALKGVAKEDRSQKWLTDAKLNLLVHKTARDRGEISGNIHHPTPDKEEGDVVPMTNVWAIGDCSSQATPLPATAQVANQKGSYLASVFNASPTNPTAQQPFKFKDKGSMASIGSNEALIDSPVGKDKGALAWLLWRSAYTIMAMSWRNRFLVPANWASNLLFGRDVGRF
ncbi:NDE2, mitochondrial exteRNAl NADH dehydrogenase [Moesziomyces antarcticus]|uniref:NDE2, mitochondrial exteRNAl NADH dehydrogenase n=2 Tax=Pseudozyma antarctica TaxID=84753 RepID=A0A081CDY6_PSEA2|nr:NDE2, mitochondrial exteRNAl NADH dehydrogenase [Moesziomyces antarcticus]GAK64882.1 NDE2, mitochondrial exteRNAl NADH dehydrogenase [Moesziomyces antarcticus]SPO46133.1 related to NDE1 - mitochondrial cytosolically directed NADH dehydrogenase [Moesziomyces antarcticus]